MTPSRIPNLLALLVAGAYFMEFLDGTVIATAIPQMAVTFKVHPVDLGIGMSAYLITVAVLLPLSGWVADSYGPRLVFSTALAVFTLASLLCAVSQTLSFFVFARILQGAAGAMMVPVGRLVVLRTTAKKDLIRAIAVLTWPALLAPIIAPPLGGFATTYLTWHWVFLINLPFGLIGLALAWMIVPVRQDGTKRSLDWIGFLLTGLACLALMSGVELLGAQTVNWNLAGSCFVAGLCLGASAVIVMRRNPVPLLDFSVLNIPSFSTSVIGGSLFRIAISTVPFLLPLMFQIGFGYDAFTSGLLILPLFVGNILIKPATTSIIRKWGFRSVLIGNGIIVAVAITACAVITPLTPLALTIAILFVGGMARSMQFTTINTIAFADVPEVRMGDANTLFNTLQQISLGLGIAAGALALRIAQIWRPAEAASATATPQEFHWAFLMMGIVALAAVADAVTLQPETGLHVSRG